MSSIVGFRGRKELCEDAIGAGGTYFWNFKALKKGKTTITFKYYRDWEGESSAKSEDTVVYTFIV